MRKLTIGLVCPYSFLVHGGTQEHTKTLGQALVLLGHKVIYLSPDPKNKQLPQPHISIGANIRVPTPNGSWAEISVPNHNAQEIKEIIKSNKIDLLHFQEILSPTSCWRWLKYSNVPNIVTFHAGWNNPRQSDSFATILKTIEPLIKPFIAKSLSSSVVSEVCNSNLLVNNTIVPPTINSVLLAATNSKPKAYQKPGHHLLFIGRFDIRKGAVHLVNALHLIPQELNIYLHIIGKGPEKEDLSKLIDSYNLSGRIIFHGACDNQTKFTYLHYAEAFVAPSTHGESFGMVLVEALAAGCPVIAGNNSGYADTLKDYPYQQYVLDPRDPQLLSKAIISLCTNKEHQRVIKRWAKPFVQQFSPENIAKKHLDIYEQVLANQTPQVTTDDQHKISFYDQGDKHNPTLIVLHGHRSDGERMLPLSQALSATHRVLTPDLPGSGSSPCLSENTIDNLAHKTAEWINSLDIKSYSLVGLSMGGIVSIRMLKYLTKRPTHLYLYGTPTDSSELTPNKIQQGIMLLLKKWRYGTKVATTTAETLIRHTLIMKALYKLWYPFMASETRDYEINQWRSQQPRVLIETMRDIITHPLSDEPISLVPTTYISAHHDNLLNSQLVKMNVKKLLPNTKFVTIKLNVHVPKGPLTQVFFQPFLDTILNKQNNQA